VKLLERIWDFKIQEKEYISMRERALRVLAGFLIIMFLFTILSRAANAMTIPRVQVESAAKKTIEHTVEQEGKIEADGEQAVTTAGGLKIKSVQASNGMQVEEGTPLLELDMEDIAEKIKELETELGKYELSISDAKYNKGLQESDRSTGIKRAQEDYNSITAEHNARVDTAKRQMDEACTAWENVKNNPDPENENAEDQTALKAAYEEKQVLYNDALTARDQALKEASRAIEDARKSSSKDSTAESTALDKESVEAKLAKYQQLQKQNGIITAPGKGTITFVDTTVVTGGVTPETSMMLISDASKGLKFTATLDEDQQKYVAVGDEVTIVNKNNEEINNVTVESMAPNAESPENRDIVANLGDTDKVQVYDTATLKVKISSKAYSTCIPKAALRKGGSGESDYVLVLTEKKSVLGTQLVAEKLAVTVQEQNESYAALADNEVTSVQQMIVDSDKEIQAGDRVRLAESNE